MWTDPEFDPSLHAFYYARVLEIPTPRWTTIQAQKLGIAPPDVVAATLQERAWSSPIWYTPSAEARKAAKPGTTVADLKKKGAVALNDAQLKTLIVAEVCLAAKHGDGRQVHDHLRRPGPGRQTREARRRSSLATLPSASPPTRASFRFATWTKKMPLQSLTGDPVEASYRGDIPDLQHPGREDRHLARRHADRDHRLQGR